MFTLRPSDPKKHINYAFNKRSIRGVYKPGVEKDFVYALPFKEGENIVIGDSRNFGKTTMGEDMPKDWKAFGVRRSKPDTIMCARRGVVVKIVEEFTNDGLIKKFTSKRNYITIEHKDGTFGNYKGFKKGSILVKEGEEVNVQQSLGVLDRFNDYYLFHFKVYYLDLNQKNIIAKKDSKKRMRRTAYVDPFFKTDKGVVKLVDKQEYKVSFGEDLFTKEFSKRELKKYKKGLK